jgi:hypothetical protein
MKRIGPLLTEEQEFVGLRIDADAKKKLEKQAEHEGVSLNQLLKSLVELKAEGFSDEMVLANDSVRKQAANLRLALRKVKQELQAFKSRREELMEAVVHMTVKNSAYERAQDSERFERLGKMSKTERDAAIRAELRADAVKLAEKGKPIKAKNLLRRYLSPEVRGEVDKLWDELEICEKSIREALSEIHGLSQGP